MIPLPCHNVTSLWFYSALQWLGEQSYCKIAYTALFSRWSYYINEKFSHWNSDFRSFKEKGSIVPWENKVIEANDDSKKSFDHL